MTEPIGSYYEFFAGGGMVRAGLGRNWECLFANDFDHKKSSTYQCNWGGEHLKTGDVRKIITSELPSMADLIWASFPCQDLSLAGGGAGLRGERSGTFWPFWNIVQELSFEGRAPSVMPATIPSPRNNPSPSPQKLEDWVSSERRRTY